MPFHRRSPLIIVLLVVLSFASAGSAAAQTSAHGNAKSRSGGVAPGQGRRVFLPPDPRDEAAILAEDAQIPREQVPTGPLAELSLFGSPPAQGRSFVFVIDRSSSMGSAGLGAISAAAAELSIRIKALTPEHKFQIVAYNEATSHLSGRLLVPATDENKQKLVKYVSNLTASGQTEHRYGLLAALRLKPEVIFLLTDGGDPVLSKADLQFLRQQTGGRTSIHCVHFGRGARPQTSSFLERLATENRGSYVFFDVNAR